MFLSRALTQQSRIILLDELLLVLMLKQNAIMGFLLQLHNEGYLILVSTHNLGSVLPDYCDQVVMINRTILAKAVLNDLYAKNLN